MESGKIAVQVYSVREQAEKDLPGTLKALKKYGYQGVELAGLYGYEAEEMRRLLEEIGLTAVSAHVGLDAFLTDIEETVRTYQTIGCRYLVIPMLPMECLYGGEKYEETLELFGQISGACQKAGMGLLYHNHSFEFVRTDKGSYVLDELFAAFQAGELDTEQDTCWVQVAGENPLDYLEKYKGRCPLVHVKDFRKQGDQAELLALGEGELDVAAVATKALECGARWLIVEQDDHTQGEPMADMEKSCRYLKEVLS